MGAFPITGTAICVLDLLFLKVFLLTFLFRLCFPFFWILWPPRLLPFCFSTGLGPPRLPFPFSALVFHALLARHFFPDGIDFFPSCHVPPTPPGALPGLPSVPYPPSPPPSVFFQIFQFNSFCFGWRFPSPLAPRDPKPSRAPKRLVSSSFQPLCFRFPLFSPLTSHPFSFSLSFPLFCETFGWLLLPPVQVCYQILFHSSLPPTSCPPLVGPSIFLDGQFNQSLYGSAVSPPRLVWICVHLIF